MKDKFFYEDEMGIIRLTPEAKDIFNPAVAEAEGYIKKEGYADGQNWWRWEDKEGFVLFGSSELCEREELWFTELPNEFKKLFSKGGKLCK